MNLRRILVGTAALALGAGLLLPAVPAQADRRCDDGYRSSRYRSAYRYGGYRDGGYRRYRRARYDDDYGYRSRSRYRSYTEYRPVRRYRSSYYTTSYDRPYYYSSSRSRYSCGCGQRFASSYWLDYHQDHTSCG